MIVITGAAGFIGSCIVAKLNGLGKNDLILVDHYEGNDDPKKRNLVGKEYVRFLDKQEFLKDIEQNPTSYSPWAVEGVKLLKDKHFFD